MEEIVSLSKSKRPRDYEDEERAKNKTLINYRKVIVDPCWESSFEEANFGDGGDLLGDFPWPPRSYTCTFCKREFRSAQALGGHMNVHRREKARLRQKTTTKYLPLLHTRLNLDENPNPNPISMTFASNTSPFPSMFKILPYSSVQTCSSSLAISAPSFDQRCPSDSANFTAVRSQKSDLTVDAYDDLSHEKESLIVKKSENGSLAYSKFDDLDLELRLGYL